MDTTAGRVRSASSPARAGHRQGDRGRARRGRIRVVLGARTVSQVEEAAAEIRARAAGASRAARRDRSGVRARFVCRRVGQLGADRRARQQRGQQQRRSDDGAVGPLWEINPRPGGPTSRSTWRGTFLCSHAALPHMVDRGRGHIVNVTSMVAAIPGPYDSAYVCSKAGQVRLTDSLAAEVHDHGIVGLRALTRSCGTELVDGAVWTEAGQKWLAPGVGQLAIPTCPRARRRRGRVPRRAGRPTA